MNWTIIKVYAGIVGAAALAFLLQKAVVPDPDQALRAARSEITAEVLAERLSPTTRPFAAAETRTVAETRPSPGGPRASTGAWPRRDPDTDRGEHLSDRRQALTSPWPFWVRWLLLRDTNRATNEAEPAPGQETRTFAMTMADPVLVRTGEMTLNFPIVNVAGVGLDFKFALSYRSGFIYNGPIGNRWEHNWNARYQYAAGTPATLYRYAENRKDAYVDSDADGIYTSPAGFAEERKITKYNDGTNNRVDRRLRDGTLEIYKELTSSSNWYVLTEVQHRNSNNAITVGFDGSKRPTTITDTRGKFFSMTYDTNGRVSTFEDWSGAGPSRARYWTFTYTNDDLTQIAVPGSRTTTFGYTGTSLLETIRAPREGPSGSAYLVNTYDNGRVITQQLGASTQTFSMSYSATTPTCTETDREGAKRIFEWNTANAVIKVRREVASGTFADTLIEWDSEHPTKITYPENNGIQLRYDGNRRLIASVKCNASGIGSSDTPGNMRNSTNFLVTEYSYQTGTNWDMVSQITDPNGNAWALGRDSLGNVTSYTTPQYPSDPYVITYDNSNSRVETIDDPAGRKVGFSYGTTGTLSQVIVDPTGTGALALTTTLTRDTFENVIKVKDPENRETTYDRNIAGFVTKVTSPLGSETDYLYDANDGVTEVHRDIDSSTERVDVYTRNIMDLVTQEVESGKTRTYAYDKNDHLNLVTLPVNTRKLQHIYDMRGLEIARTVGYGSSASVTDTMAYDGNGRLTTSTDGVGNDTTFAYDGFDRLVTVTDAAGHYSTKTFDKNGNIIRTSAYASGGTELSRTAHEFDANNRQTKIKRHAVLGGATVDTTFAYDKSGKLTAKTDGCGCGTGNVTYAYDKAARLTKTVDAATNEVVYGLDKSGLVTLVTNNEKESGTTKTYVVQYTYDADKRLSKIEDKGSGSSTKLVADYDRDRAGQATKITDGNSNEVLQEFDYYGRITKVQRGGSGSYVETQTVYDLDDNVTAETSVRAGTDSTTTYTYDDADRLNVMTDEEGSTPVKTLVYDDAGNVVQRTDGNGSVAALTYDSRNLVIQIDYTLATNVVGVNKEKFEYDGLGRITFAINERGSGLYDARVKRTWTVLSKLNSETLWVDPASDSDAASPSRAISYTYDSSGRVENKVYADGTTIKLGYDSLNRVNTMTRDDPTSGTTWVSIAGWTFQGPRRMIEMQFGNGVKETMSYDEYGRAVELYHDRPNGGTRSPMYYFKRGYDAGDRVVRERRDYYNGTSPTALAGARDFGDVYVYDHQNRLATVVRGVGYATTTHAAVDNLTTTSLIDSTVDFSTKTHYTLDEGGNRQTLRYDVPGGGNSVRKEIHAFDLENELTTRDVITYSGGSSSTVSESPTYDGNGSRVISSVMKVDVHNRIYQVTTAGPDWRYRYDPFGRRVQKRDVSSGGTYWRNFYYDGVTCVLEWNMHLDGTPTEYSTPMWVRAFGPYLVDQLIWVKVDPCGTCGNYTNTSGFLHLDYLGSAVMGTLESDATIYETYRYDEYGQPYFYYSDGSSTGGVSLVDQAYLYTGREWDKDIEKYYYRARWYDQAVGRFLSRDPVRNTLRFEAYAYSDDEPVNHVDPWGLQCTLDKLPKDFCAEKACPGGGIATPDLACMERERLECKKKADENHEEAMDAIMEALGRMSRRAGDYLVDDVMTYIIIEYIQQGERDTDEKLQKAFQKACKEKCCDCLGGAGSRPTSLPTPQPPPSSGGEPRRRGTGTDSVPQGGQRGSVSGFLTPKLPAIVSIDAALELLGPAAGVDIITIQPTHRAPWAGKCLARPTALSGDVPSGREAIR